MAFKRVRKFVHLQNKEVQYERATITSRIVTLQIYQSIDHARDIRHKMTTIAFTHTLDHHQIVHSFTCQFSNHFSTIEHHPFLLNLNTREQ